MSSSVLWASRMPTSYRDGLGVSPSLGSVTLVSGGMSS